MKYLHIVALAVALAIAAGPAEAGRQAPAAQPGRPPVPFQEPTDARETRDRLRDVLNQYPPSVREVLRIDPTLLSRSDYLTTYPVLASFLERHPEVAHNPGFFLGDWSAPENTSPAGQAFRELGRMFEQLTMLLVIVTITTGMVWLVRTAIEHRRWQRTLRAQTELNTKLIDRFSSSDELIAYLQSPAGRNLTEPAALPQASPRPMPMNAPLSRIFWSIQSGIVVGALGTGLMIVGSTVSSLEIHQSLRGFGIVLLMVGVGFAVSAVVSFVLSERLGLVQPMTPRVRGEAPES